MKPKSVEQPTYIPIVNRTNKPERKLPTQPINQIQRLTEKEKILDQVLELEKDVLTIGSKLTHTAGTSIPSGSDQTEWFNELNELEYKFIQKENELNDTKLDLHSISQDLESNPQTTQIDRQPEFATINARIKAKEREVSQSEQKLLHTKHQIEADSKVFQERLKRHLQSKEEEDEFTRPKKPAIDRTSKPTHEPAVTFPQRHREFSPVYGTYGGVGTTGLQNLGNTCYMNSIIQCLLNVPLLRKYLVTNVYLKNINRKSKTHGEVTEELAQLGKQIWAGQYKSVAPRDFRNVIGRENQLFASYDQQDSHEFLVILIDILNSELQVPMNEPLLSEKKNKSEVAWREFVKNMHSVIQTLFFGQIRSTLKCKSCGFESPTYDGFSHLSLELPQNNEKCYLHDCMDLYFHGELIDGWTCPQCKQSRQAIKKLDIAKLPQVLVIHLKRFNASLTGSCSYEKKQNYVYFPTADFQITDYITPSLKRSGILDTYNLCAVSNHYGTINRGHYTAFCKKTNSKQWYKYDDNYVTQIRESDVCSSAGYILFYSLKDENFN